MECVRSSSNRPFGFFGFDHGNTSCHLMLVAVELIEKRSLSSVSSFVELVSYNPCFSIIKMQGLIPTTLCLIGVAVLSSYVCLHMANTVSKMPKNANFDQPVEFSDPFKTFWNTKAYKVTQILFFLTSICLNVAAIVDTAEVVDSVFGLQGTAYGISFDHGLELKSWNVLESTYDHRVESINWQKYLNNNNTRSTTTTISNATSMSNNNSITFTNGRNIIIPSNITTNTINKTNISTYSYSRLEKGVQLSSTL